MTAASSYARMLAYARPERRAIAFALGLSALLAAAAALQPWPMKLLVDYALSGAALPQWLESMATHAGLTQGGWSLIAASALLALALFAASAAMESALTLSWSRTGQRLVYALATHLFSELQRLSLRFHAQRSVGDALSRVTGDAWAVHAVTEGVLVSPVRHVCVIVFVGVLAWHLDQSLAIVLVSAVPLLAVSAFWFGSRMKLAEKAKREAVGGITSFVHQVLSAMPVVQAFGAADRNVRVFESVAARAVRANERGAVLTTGFGALNGAALTIALALVIYVGGGRVLAHELTLGALLVFIAYTRSIDGATRALLRTYGALRGAEASVDRVLEVLDERDRIEDAPGAQPLPPRSAQCGQVIFQDVSFGYDPARPVLHGISLDIAAGETVALVGTTGAGKTTLASFVPRFFDPQRGRVLLDGRDVKHVTLASLRREIALVLHDPFILPISVAQNIAYGRPDASPEDVVAAAVAANAHEFIRELPDRYDTVLGEQGATLSGGQQQRIAIARALAADPRVLILDEPTSALDAATEALVMEALERLMAGRTTIIIAHRLVTARRASRIAVLDRGCVVELGSHAELIAAGGVYARLYALSAFGASEPHA